MNLNQAIHAARAGKQAAMQPPARQLKDTQIEVHLPAELRDRLEAACKHQGVKRTDVVRLMILNYVERVEALQSGKL